MTNDKKMNTLGKKLNSNLDKFITHLDSINDTLPMSMLLVLPYSQKAIKKFEAFLKKNAKQEKDGLLIKADESIMFETLENNASISMLALKIIPESLFVSLISQYDAFLNRLLRIIFEINPEILNGSEKNITFSQLVQYKNINEARNFVVEKEIDCVLRESHTEQFEYLEKILDIPLRKKLPIWDTFVEITERRNLFVHCDGTISNQYINNCKNSSTKNNISVGIKLNVSPEYFFEAYKCLYEIGVKLTHTIWRKLLINDLEHADEELNSVCYKLLDNKSYKLADVLLNFACDQKKKFNEISENIFIVNLALSKHLNNKQKEAKEILSKKDWSASGDEFKLAKEVITENYDAAYVLMKRIGKNGSVKKREYKEWILFKKIRRKSQFKKIYKEIFGEEFSVLKIPPRPLAELIGKLRKEKKLKKKNVDTKKSSHKHNLKK